MHPLIKVLIGLVLLVAPLALYAYDFMKVSPIQITLLGKTIKLTPLASLWTVLQGSVPPFVALIGLFIVWLELDEWRIEKELKKEEMKEKKEKKAKKK